MHQSQPHATGQIHHQSYQQQQQKLAHPTGHILATVTKTTAQSLRPATIISTNASRKREHTESYNLSTAAQIKNAVKNLNPTLLSLTAADQPPRSTSPGSTDGSTTVSATSSPGIDQQEQEEFNALSSLHQQNRSIRDELQFPNVDTHLIHHTNQKNHQHLQPIAPVPTSSVTSQQSHQHQQQRHVAFQSQSQQQQQVISSNRNSNGNNDELTPRKRPRKQQFTDSSPLSKKFIGAGSMIITPPTPSTSHHQVRQTGQLASGTIVGGPDNGIQLQKSHLTTKSNKDSSKAVEYFIKKPRTCSLLDVSTAITNPLYLCLCAFSLTFALCFSHYLGL